MTKSYPIRSIFTDRFQNAYTNLSNTILGNRIMGEFYLAEEDYENSIKVSKLGLGALDRLELDSGKVLSK
jgi:superkiller protein 3